MLFVTNDVVIGNGHGCCRLPMWNWKIKICKWYFCLFHVHTSILKSKMSIHNMDTQSIFKLTLSNISNYPKYLIANSLALASTFSHHSASHNQWSDQLHRRWIKQPSLHSAHGLKYEHMIASKMTSLHITQCVASKMTSLCILLNASDMNS